MRCEWALVTGPQQEPITVAEAKLQARVTLDDELSLLEVYRKVAREAAEQYMNRGLFTQTWKLTLGAFADVIWLPMAAPLQTTPTAPIVKYYDSDGVQQTLAATFYTVDATSRPGRIVRAPNQTWPSVQSDRLDGPVEITYVVGWSTVAAIPERIKQGIRLYVSSFFADREGMDLETMRRAAEACWPDVVYWKEPQCYAYED